MKKFISLVLALVMALSLTTVAWGETLNATPANFATALASASAGDTISLAAGDYVLHMPNGTATGLKFVGAEAGVNVKFNAVETTNYSVPEGTYFENINFTAFDANYSIHATGTIKNVKFYKCTFAATNKQSVLFAGPVDGLTIEECKFANSGHTALMFQNANTTNVVIEKNTFENCGYSAINFSNGVTGDIKIVGNIIDTTADRAVRISAATGADVSISGNKVTNGVDGSNEVIKISGTGVAAAVQGNTFNDAGAKVAVGAVEDAIEITMDANGKVTAGEFYSEPANIADGLAYVNGTIVPASSVGANILSGNYFVKGTGAGAVASAAVVSVTDAKAPKDADKNGTIDATEVGNVKYFNIAGDTAKYIQVASVGEADMIVYYSNTESVFAYLKAVPSVEYYGTGVAFNNFGEKCGQVDYEPVTGVKYYSFENVVYETTKTAATRYLMVGNELVGVKALGVTPNPHVPAYTYDKDYKVVGVKCAKCGVPATLYANWAAIPKAAQADALALGDGRYYVWGAIGAAGTNGDKVQSAETFDAGIAMYVGMSVMAAAGSAVVLKKRED